MRTSKICNICQTDGESATFTHEEAGETMNEEVAGTIGIPVQGSTYAKLSSSPTVEETGSAEERKDCL